MEFFVQIGAVALVMGIGLGLCYLGRTSDTMTEKFLMPV